MRTDTIAAIATAMSSSGIGIIRISGDEAVGIVDRIFSMKNGKKLSDMPTHTIHYGHIKDGDEVIDEVMVVLMRAPKSYTKEDTVEIDCHGGVYVMKRVLETVIKYGARPAEPGEFTKRAFLNGRIDLAQAESVIDIIHAKNEFALKSSEQQLSGSLSAAVRKVREKLLHEIAFIESALDDPEHISLDGYPETLHGIVEEAQKEIQKLLANSDNGKILKRGYFSRHYWKTECRKIISFKYARGRGACYRYRYCWYHKGCTGRTDQLKWNHFKCDRYSGNP